MRTEELIGALVADLTATRTTFRQIFAGAVVLGTVIAAGFFFAFIGLRPDFDHALESARFPLKFLFTLALLTTATGLLSRLAVPGVSAGGWASALLAPPIALAVAVAAELLVLPGAAWWPNLVGSNARLCLMLIPLLSIGPLACLLIALRQGAPSEPGLAGAVAGLVAGGVAATLYASNCTDDSPLFVATWYTLAIVVVSSAGYALGSCLLKW